VVILHTRISSTRLKMSNRGPCGKHEDCRGFIPRANRPDYCACSCPGYAHSYPPGSGFLLFFIVLSCVNLLLALPAAVLAFTLWTNDVGNTLPQQTSNLSPKTSNDFQSTMTSIKRRQVRVAEH